jgi:hypothetical protein
MLCLKFLLLHNYLAIPIRASKVILSCRLPALQINAQ